MSDLSIGFEGLDHLQKMTTPELYKQELQTIVTKGAIYGENRAKGFAPVDTGRLRGAISHEIGSLQSRYGVIGGGTVGEYGKKLDESVGRKYRYRRGPRQGDLLKDWFTQTYALTQAEAQRLISAAITRIESTWRNG